MGYMETYKAWCENEYFDEDTRAELKSIAGDEKEIEDRFYKDLEFGTGGLRGVIGNGTNRMNVYIVRKATQGLANFIIKEARQRAASCANSLDILLFLMIIEECQENLRRKQLFVLRLMALRYTYSLH